MTIRALLISTLAAITLGATGPATANPSDTDKQIVLEPALRAGAPQTHLRRAVHAYSDAFLGGRARTAFALLSPRCRDSTTYADFAEIVDTAHELYGRLPIRSYSASINGSKARVTYRYDVRRLDQVREPWVRRSAGWRNNQC